MAKEDFFKSYMKALYSYRKPNEDVSVGICNTLYRTSNIGFIDYRYANFCVLEEGMDYDRIVKLPK